MRQLLRAATALLLLPLPGLVMAHSPIEGMDSFYSGVLHPALVPAHLLVLLTAGMLIGQQGLKKMQPPMIAFLLMLIVMLLLTGLLDVALAENAALALMLSVAVLCGLLVAFEVSLSQLSLMAIALLTAFLVGMDSSQPELAGRARLAILTGTGVGAFLLILYAAAAAEFASRAWQKIGIRILGSWATASAFIVLAFTFASPGA
ncbi:MAG: HupE/UreJ family protein [Gammaproteobacteria bacterium]|jgi:hydrogenase/urease accessory protein HupE